YVLHTWVQRSGEEVVLRYREGSHTMSGLRYLSGFSEPPEIEQVRDTMDDILRGAFTGDLGLALRRAGAVATIVAHGTAHLADSDPGDERTRQAERLLSTGEELAAAARHAEAGTLDGDAARLWRTSSEAPRGCTRRARRDAAGRRAPHPDLGHSPLARPPERALALLTRRAAVAPGSNICRFERPS